MYHQTQVVWPELEHYYMVGESAVEDRRRQQNI